MSEEVLDKFKGALIGCAVGDALGAPFEGMTAPDLANMEAIVDDFWKIPGYPLGQYTDDTQLTLALAETLAEHGKFDGDDFGARVARLWETREIVGAGGACTHAAVNLIHGLSWKEAGAPEGRAGNGTAMRASPVGLFRFRDSELLVSESLDQSMVTHQDPRSGAGAVAAAFAVAWNLEDRPADPAAFSEAAAKLVEPVHEEFAGWLLELPRLLSEDDDKAVIEISCAGWIDPPRPVNAVTAFVIPTVLASLWAFFRNPEDYSRAVDEVIRLGGDVDTTAAITGAMVGARTGIGGIPEHLAKGVKDSDKIQDLASRLYQKLV